jgi:hypothetical protein
MSINVYDTHTLLGVIYKLPPVKTFWLDLAFPRVQTFDTEFIDFDVVSRGRRLAPFVAPTAQGKPMLQEGFNTKRFKPAYVKPKDSVDPRRVFKRMPGEGFMGTMSPQQRRDAIVADILTQHMDMHKRRQEWMAAQAIIGDSVTVAGDNYPTTVISFGRTANHTVTLTGGACWGQSGVSITNLLETWMSRIQLDSGYAPTMLVLGVDAWNVFRLDAGVIAQLNTLARGSVGNLQTGLGDGELVQYKGTLGASLQVWVYNDIYEDDSGVNQPMMDPKKIVLLNPAGVEGVRCFGAILDAQAGYMATDVWPKNFFQDDPSAEFVMTQSAPLMVPSRPDAVLCASVV